MKVVGPGSPLWGRGNEEKYVAWTDLLFTVLRRGGCIQTSTNELAARWGWGRMKVWRFLKELESMRLARLEVGEFEGKKWTTVDMRDVTDHVTENVTGDVTGFPLLPQGFPDFDVTDHVTENVTYSVTGRFDLEGGSGVPPKGGPPSPTPPGNRGVPVTGANDEGAAGSSGERSEGFPPALRNLRRVEQAVERATDAAGLDWDLEESIESWSARLIEDFPRVALVREINEAAEWLEEMRDTAPSKLPKRSVGRFIRRWLKRAETDESERERRGMQVVDSEHEYWQQLPEMRKRLAEEWGITSPDSYDESARLWRKWEKKRKHPVTGQSVTMNPMDWGRELVRFRDMNENGVPRKEFGPALENEERTALEADIRRTAEEAIVAKQAVREGIQQFKASHYGEENGRQGPPGGTQGETAGQAHLFPT